MVAGQFVLMTQCFDGSLIAVRFFEQLINCFLWSRTMSSANTTAVGMIVIAAVPLVSDVLPSTRLNLIIALHETFGKKEFEACFSTSVTNSYLKNQHSQGMDVRSLR
jgi:hypothetical protein